MSYNEYWETDEFEDLVARSLIGLYETKIRRQRGVPKSIKFDQETFLRCKKMGCYFTPNDREFYVVPDKDGMLASSQEIDIVNDGLPDRAILTLNPQNESRGSYLWSFYLEKLPKLPHPWKSDLGGKFFRITQLDFSNDHVWGGGTIISVNKKGELQSCYLTGQFRDPTTGLPVYLQKHRPVLDRDKGACEDYFSLWASVTIQCYQDRRYLWNVQAHDGVAKSIFGVYPEQIKSLFYARDLPQTDTGRKRPILHWVNSHQRRMKSGVEIDVEKYLRGTHEFVMNGTKFKITNPLKEEK